LNPKTGISNPSAGGGGGPARASSYLIVGALRGARVELGDFRHPALALGVLQRHYLFVRPVKVKSDVRYLLIEPL
jgi:hypothetical protein